MPSVTPDPTHYSEGEVPLGLGQQLLTQAGSTLALSAQVLANMWVRDGEGMLLERFEYMSSAVVYHDLDLKQIQVCQAHSHNRSRRVVVHTHICGLPRTIAVAVSVAT